MRPASGILAFVGLLAAACGAHAQEPPRITVRVRQVAGASIYLDVGTAQGLATGDTLTVLGGGARPLGKVVVTASTEARSVLTYAGDPFAVSRGDDLTLLLRRAPLAPVPAEAPARPAVRTPDQARAAPARTEAAARPAPRPHGRVTADLGGIRSQTQMGGAGGVDLARTYATPALRMDLTVPGAVGGFTLHASGRVAYRYSSEEAVQPAGSTRIYAASLERRFTSVPVTVMLGRFHSPAERYSGYWDGILVRVGGSDLGVGAIGGLEPDRWNEGFSTQLPKATAFVDARARGAGWRWQGNLSVHTVRPADSLPAHTFVGATQGLTVGPLHLSHDVQADQDPFGGPWRVSRLNARAGLEVAPGVEVRVGLARRESYVPGRPADPFAARRDRLDGGIGIRGGSGYISADVDLSRGEGGAETRGASLFAAAYRLPGLGRVGLSGSASRWSGAYGNTLSLAPGLTADLTPASVRLGYRWGRTDHLDRIVTSQGVDAALDAPLGSGVGFSVRARTQWGGPFRSQGLDLSLYRIF